MGTRAFLTSATLVILVSACESGARLGVCTDELRVHFTPADTTILAGQSFSASVQLATCGGTVKLSDTFTWQSNDPAVATVDSATGRVVGRGPGEARIVARGAEYGLIGGLHLTVGVP
jgi:outer membrane biogenesis lipoprotein LolB